MTAYLNPRGWNTTAEVYSHGVSMDTRRRTGGRNDRPILNDPIDADKDENLYRCHYSGEPVSLGASIFIGPCVPQVHGTYVCHPAAKPAFQESKRAFDESEANCNTCRHLHRVVHKRSAGVLYGRCLSPAQDMGAHPYRDRIVYGVMPFHPDDYMGMPCYEART